MALILILLIATTAVVSFMAFYNAELFDRLKFNAYYTKNDKQWYRLFSYALVHADWGHLIINMFVLWSFGRVVSMYFTATLGSVGNLYFLILYVGGALFATVYDYLKQNNNIYYNAVGASGAVAAVVFSSIILEPMGQIGFIFIPIGIPSWVFGILYLAYSAYMAKRANDNIGHSAHFWGAVFGVAFTLLINPAFIQHFYRQLGFSF